MCNASYFSCPAKRLETAITICVLIGEYLSIKEQKKNHSSIPKGAQEDATPNFFFDGIAVYDYHFDDEEKWPERKEGSGKTGASKRPHVRQGTWRFNRNTGEKDIFVKASVIHKEQYKGYETSDRLV